MEKQHYHSRLVVLYGLLQEKIFSATFIQILNENGCIVLKDEDWWETTHVYLLIYCRLCINSDSSYHWPCVNYKNLCLCALLKEMVSSVSSICLILFSQVYHYWSFSCLQCELNIISQNNKGKKCELKQ